MAWQNQSPYQITVQSIAQEIVDNLGDCELSPPYVASWIRASIGKINVLIATSYILDVNSEYSPNVTFDSKEIIKYAYYQNYYSKKANSLLNNAARNSIVELRDGKSSVTFERKNEIAKSYRVLFNDWTLLLKTLSDLYKRNRVLPASVYGITPQAPFIGPLGIPGYPINLVSYTP